MSAEVIALHEMTAEQAEKVTEQIAYRIDSITENYEVVMSLMRDALARGAHAALGYASPGAYIADRFGKSLQTLGTALRREFVHELSDAGLSTRAIAPVFNVSHMTVKRDIEAAAGVTPVTPEPVAHQAGELTESEFSDRYGMRPDEADALISSGLVSTPDEWEQAVGGMRVNTRTGEVIEDAPVITEHTVTEKVKTTIGLDGKEYKRPEPKPVPTGDDANRLNAIQASKSIGRSLEALQYLNYENARNGIVTEWWPLGKHEVPPEQANYFTPAELRKLAQGLNKTADLLEAHHVN